jgi:hypothetical protein
VNHSLTVQDSVIGFTPGPRAHGLAWPYARQKATHRAADDNPLATLSARFRLVRRMVGEASFRSVALRYIANEPPHLAVPQRHGETFPAFIRQQGSGGSIDYVADIAALELAVGKARDADRAAVNGAKASSRLLTRLSGGLKVALHPSASLVQSRFPIVAIWESLQSGRRGMIDHWRPEAALVVRPLRRVEIVRLPPGGYAFLHALSYGQTIAVAAEAAAAAAADFALTPNLMLLQKTNVVIGLRAVGSFEDKRGES